MMKLSPRWRSVQLEFSLITTVGHNPVKNCTAVVLAKIFTLTELVISPLRSLIIYSRAL